MANEYSRLYACRSCQMHNDYLDPDRYMEGSSEAVTEAFYDEQMEMEQPLLTEIDAKKPNQVVINTGGYAIDAQVVDGKLMVFVYKQATRDEGCVAMAYDGSLPHDENIPIALVGNEKP